MSYNAVDPNGPRSFAEFKASPSFHTTQRQLLERIAQCDRFAGERFTAQEAEQIRDGLNAFRDHLLLNDGETFFNTALPKLFGSGKRYFDNFCLRLAQDDIDLHLRKTALRELAADLPLCRSSEAAFRAASAALSRKPGGLHGEFHALLLQRIDALLRQVVKLDPHGAPLTGEALAQRETYLRGMEVHAVNRLKLELDLPGAEPDDRYTCDSVVTRGLIRHAQDLLRSELHPAVLARDLAESYMQQLWELLPPEDRSPKAELSDSVGRIGEANARMRATFGDVPLDHLLLLDDDTGQTFWQKDLSLLTHDLLKSLEAQDLVVRQEPGKLLSGFSEQRHWDLLHVDWRLFLVNERDHLQSPPALVPVRLHHALALLHRMPRQLPVHALTTTLLDGGRLENLKKLPAHWLEDEAQCLQHCRALSDPCLKDWVAAAHPLPPLQKRMLTAAMTQLDQPESLAAMMAGDNSATARDWIEWAGGFGVVRQLLSSQPGAEVVPFWTERIEPLLLIVGAEEVQQFFGNDPATSLITLAVNAAPVPVLRQLLFLTITTREAGIISNDRFFSAIRIPIQTLMKEGRQEAFDAYLDRLDLVCCAHWLIPAQMRRLLEGPHHGDGCRGAMQAGRAAMVHAFHSLVRLAHSRGDLTTDMARGMIMGTPPAKHSCGWEAIDHRHPAALAAHLQQVQDGVHAQLIAPHELRDLLKCENDTQRPGLGLMLLDADARHPCLDAWIQAVANAHRAGLLTPQDITALLHAHSRTGTPVLHRIMANEHRRDAAVSWLDLVRQMSAANALPAGEVVPLLESRLRSSQGSGETVLSEAVKGMFPEGAIRATLTLYGRAHQMGLVSKQELMTLLRADMDDADKAPFLIVAIHCGRVTELIEYLDGIRELAEGGQLDGSALLKLLDVGNPRKESALTVAMINRNLPAVAAILEASLALAEQGLLSGDRWCRLMMPVHYGRPIYELSACDDHELLRLFEGAIQRAEQGGLLGGKVGGDLALLWQQFRNALPEVQQAMQAQEALAPPTRLTDTAVVDAPAAGPRAPVGDARPIQAQAQGQAQGQAQAPHPANARVAARPPQAAPAQAGQPPAARLAQAERPSAAAGRAALERAAMAARAQAPVPEPQPAPRRPQDVPAPPPPAPHRPQREGIVRPAVPFRPRPLDAEPPPLPQRPLRPAAEPPGQAQAQPQRPRPAPQAAAALPPPAAQARPPLPARRLP